MGIKQEKQVNIERGVNMYSDKVMDHFSNPRNVGEMKMQMELDKLATLNVGI